MKINLVKNGVFPIVVDLNGNPLETDTGYRFSGTCQGEGKLMGMPCIFIRLSGCNLRCMWLTENGTGSPCDTPYSSYTAERNITTPEDIVALINANNADKHIRYIVVSGGEPTIQAEPLAHLLMLLQKDGYHTTIETNGTIYDEEVSKYTNLVSMSPKLFNSVPTADKFTGQEVTNLNLNYNRKWEQTHNKKRINIDSIQQYIDDCYRVNFGDSSKRHKKTNKDFQLKFVVSTQADLDEILEIQEHLNLPDSFDITLMPEGYFAEDVMEKSKWVIEKCIQHGFRFTTRLHTLIFGTSRGI